VPVPPTRTRAHSGENPASSGSSSEAQASTTSFLVFMGFFEKAWFAKGWLASATCAVGILMLLSGKRPAWSWITATSGCMRRMSSQQRDHKPTTYHTYIIWRGDEPPCNSCGGSCARVVSAIDVTTDRRGGTQPKRKNLLGSLHKVEPAYERQELLCFWA